jgi:glycosyltransferase involved in cell wall biosynthesis
MIYFVYPRLRKLSGAERLILRLASHSALLGAPVTLVTHYFDAACAPALDARVPVVQTGERLEILRNHYLNAPFEYLSAVRLLRHIPFNADAITFFGPPSLPALAWSALRGKWRAPKLYFCYEPPRFIYDDTSAVTARMGLGGVLARPLFGLYKRLDRAMARRADALLANSHFGAARLRAAYERDATVITHGADLKPASPSDLQEVRSRYDLAGRFVLLTVNFLHPRKRIDLFLRAFAELQLKGAVALVVGDGPEKDELHALAHALGIAGSVRFTGFIPDEQLAAFYGASDVYVHTCRAESFGLSVLEASAAGLPVVSVDEGGPREILAPSETGLLVEASPGAVAAAIRELADDPARRKRMGEAGAQRASANYSWEQGAQDFLRAANQLNSKIPLAAQAKTEFSNP